MEGGTRPGMGTGGEVNRTFGEKAVVRRDGDRWGSLQREGLDDAEPAVAGVVGRFVVAPVPVFSRRRTGRRPGVGTVPGGEMEVEGLVGRGQKPDPGQEDSQEQPAPGPAAIMGSRCHNR